ncbi:hypothetical protein C2G38_2149636 [Gigaspora rosea]|uniref:Uncharacterized protein n=1 Tax=Gigaspora rosea TaxID=44941 RepID=A0A397TZ19_9GLOM|nr:hypothetical protein C2G38_2149636 [Gigaspora rosea]
MANKATLNTFSTNITSLTQVVNEVKSILASSDIRNQLETTKNSIDSLKCRFDIFEQNQNEFTTLMQQTNEKWNEATITEIAEAYFKTLKKERNTTPAMKLLNDQCLQRHKRYDTKSSDRLAALNKSQVKKLFSFEATSPEVSDVEEMVSPLNDQDHRSESRKTLLVPVLPWMSDEGNCIRNLADDVIKRTRVEKLNLEAVILMPPLCHVKLLKWMIKDGLICNC